MASDDTNDTTDTNETKDTTDTEKERWQSNWFSTKRLAAA